MMHNDYYLIRIADTRVQHSIIDTVKIQIENFVAVVDQRNRKSRRIRSAMCTRMSKLNQYKCVDTDREGFIYTIRAGLDQQNMH